jgi:hypothetical protein
VITCLSEPPAEVPRGGRVRNRLRTERVQEDFVVAAELDVLQAGRVAQRVQRQVEHVVRLVVGDMHLEQMQPTINLSDQPHFPRQLQHHSHAAIRDAAGLVRHFILHARRVQDRPCSRRPPFILIHVGLGQTFLDPPLASL